MSEGAPRAERPGVGVAASAHRVTGTPEAAEGLK